MDKSGITPQTSGITVPNRDNNKFVDREKERHMIKQTGRFLVPVALIGLAMLLAFFDLFSSTVVTVIAVLITVATAFLWRRFVFNNLSPDYEMRLETATDSVRLSATRWSAIIFVLTYVILLLSCGLGYFLSESWATFALIVLIVGLNAKLPYCAIATDWALHRIDSVPKNV